MHIQKHSIRALLALIALCSNIQIQTGEKSPLDQAWHMTKTVIRMPYSFVTYYLAKQPNNSKQRFLDGTYEPAHRSYQELNKDPQKPFVMGIGTSMSQTEQTSNTVHPDYLAMLLQRSSQKAKNPFQWLKEHWGYVVQSMPDINCTSCKAQIQFHTLSQGKHDATIDEIIKIIAKNRTAPTVALNECPKCHSTQIVQKTKTTHVLSDAEIEKMAVQLQRIGSFDQESAKKLPAYRLSVELTDIFKDNSDEIDPEKLKAQAQRLRTLHHPLTFFHHYANPQCKPNLFNHKEDAEWFAQRCAEIVRACPGLTHVCPISQIMGFGLQVSRGALPPFETTVTQKQFLENIVLAQVLAGREMKKINPNIQVLVSHQWKPMKTKHGMIDPRYSLEKLVCTIADYMYNQTFVKLLKPHMRDIDGIALSVYPALYFDMWKAESDNCSGKIDPSAALESIEQTAKAFPGKPIYIVETGCNNADPEMKKKFVDMTLHACKLARAKGIDVRTCYFWGHANKPYMEWNKASASCDFGAFENLNPESINEYGKYLQEVTKAHQ